MGEREERETHRETERDRDREIEERSEQKFPSDRKERQGTRSQRLPSISHFADEETKAEKR